VTALANLQKRLFHRNAPLVLFAILSLACMAAAAFLAVQVYLQLGRYGSAANDNIEWSLAQLEVDQVKLARALDQLDTPVPGQIREVRLRFDVLYSRAATFKSSNAYRETLDGNKVASTQIDAINETLQDMVALIDASDEKLIAGRRALLQATESLTPAIRRVSSAGIALDAARADAERGALTTTLRQVTVISLVMVAAMLALMWALWRLNLINQRRAHQNKITLSRLSTILNTSGDAILVVRPDDSIAETNATARRAFGLDWPTEQPVRLSDILMARGKDGALTPIEGERLQSLPTDPGKDAPQLLARGADGELVPVEVSANKAMRANDVVCVCFIRDISDRIAVEAEIQAARDKALSSERAKARFLGRSSHEMRTPLHGILGALDLLDETRLSREQERYTAIMKSSGQLLLNQINDALDIARSDGRHLTLRETIFDLESLIDGLVTTQQAEAETNDTSISVLRDGAPVGEVLGDRDRVQQVLLNLLSNAIKFTRAGQITIECTRVASTGTTADLIEVQIADTGIGIHEKDLSRIFDDFVRLAPDATSVEGTGLGLGIARNLATLMGGKIGAESIPGEGSLFWVRLPLPDAKGRSSDSAAGSDETLKSIPNLDVLLVEDNAASRFVLGTMLEQDGHSVTQTQDGAAGVAAAEARRFDLIIMDVSMPGMDGLEATRRIREGHGPSSDTRIVALTAHVDRHARIALHDAGIDSVYTKPLRLNDLRRMLCSKAASESRKTIEALDPSVTEELRAILSEGQFIRLIEGFKEEGQALLAALSAARSEHLMNIAVRLHRFGGAAATVGALDLRRAAARAETAARNGDTDALEKALPELETAWCETLDWLAATDRAA